MTVSRSAMREAVRSAALGAAYFRSFTVLRQWGQSIAPDDLPGLAVFTPRETKQRVASSAHERMTDLMVLIRRTGGESLEDDLDRDAEAAEAMALAALEALELADVQLVSAETDIPGSGEERIGSMALTFRALQLV